MKDWTKIETFSNIYQAELCKDILQNSEIEAIIINEKDSMFLIGDIELYVETNNEKKAISILNEFRGLTKINSFFMEKPIQLFKEIIENQGIKTILKIKSSEKYILDNYELYVENKDLQEAIPFVTGEKLEGWKLLQAQEHSRQTRFIIELLEEKNIDSIITKKKDSNYHLEAINIFVKEENFDKALKIITELNGWIKIAEFDIIDSAELREDILGKKKIRAIIVKKENNKFQLYVSADKEEEAIDILNKHKEWIKIKAFTNKTNALYAKSILENNDIEAQIISQRDSNFFIGEIFLYVEKINVDKAKKFLANDK